LGITSVYVTHDQEEAFSIADLVAIMNQGKMTQLGSPLDLYRRPADRFVAEFVGLSNVLPAKLVGSNDKGADIRVLGQMIHSRQPPEDPSAPISVVLRPEAIGITAGGKGGLPARVRTLAYVGPLLRYTVAIDGDGTELTVDLSNPASDEFYEEGSAVSIDLPKEVPALLS